LTIAGAVDIGGIDAAFYELSADLQYDSWLTIGMTDGSVPLSSAGIDFASWITSAGITSTGITTGEPTGRYCTNIRANIITVPYGQFYYNIECGGI
jgi:hypothetical protein